MPHITKLIAREVLDSRGRPTVEVEAHADDGAVGIAIVPSGASTGRHEAVEQRDSDDPRYGGLGVRRAVANVNGEIADALLGHDLNDQPALDAALIALDGTSNKSRLGANAILGVSLAAAHAAADSASIPLHAHLNALWRTHLKPNESNWAAPSLPMPMVNLISGGLHAGRQLDFQDFLMIPVAAQSYSEALEWSARVYRALAQVLRAHGEESALVGDEGGFGPRLASNHIALDRIAEAIEAAHLRPGADVAIALDVAASHFVEPDGRHYKLALEDRSLTSDQLSERLDAWSKRYPIVSLEDPLAEDDWDGWVNLTARLGPRMQIIGDDLFCTQTQRIEQGATRRAANAVLIKLNQVGTLTETFEALVAARRAGYRAIVSARSGETEDSTIADLAVATGAGQIKIGSVARSERLAKYNRLTRIEGDSSIPFAHWPAT